jgi:hypothetical protein
MNRDYATRTAGLRTFIQQYGLILVVYCLGTYFTSPWLMGDTVDYVSSIIAFENGQYLQFWEFGHLFWRPLGWLLFRLSNPLTSIYFGPNAYLKATAILLIINWIAALGVVLLLHALTERVCNSLWIRNLTTIGFMFSAGFLDYGQTGSAYVPGLALILLGAYLLVKNHENPKAYIGWCAGFTFAVGACFWIPLVLIIPAALFLPWFLFGFQVRSVKNSIHAALACAVFSAIAYGSVLVILRIHNWDQLMAWVTAASHGMNRMRGVPRMVYGFSNSIIDLSGDGALFKRFLKHDPFNPVSLGEMLRLSLWKLGFSYLFLSVVVLNLLRSRNRVRLFALLAVDLVPTVLFALFVFEAGDTSRYLASLPLLFLVVAASLCTAGTRLWVKVVAIVFIGVTVITNVRVMSASTLNRRQQSVAERVQPLLPHLTPESRVVTSHLQDELNNFTRDFPFNPINRDRNLQYYAVLAVNTAQIEHWREDFATMSLSVWEKGGDIWLSKRLFERRPKPQWGWVEGDDSRISWSDLNSFFSGFQIGESVGGDDGFVLLPPSESNKRILAEIPNHQSTVR